MADAMDASMDDTIADAKPEGGRPRRNSRGGGSHNPPLPPGPPPGDDLRSRLRRPTGGGPRGGGGRGGGGGGFQKPPTLKGWVPSGNQREDGKDCFTGKCEGCGQQCEVKFRPRR